jgi:spermidine/putrescine transport system substrate-binding protein
MAFSGCVKLLRGGKLPDPDPATTDKLFIYTWSGYTDDELAKRFTAETGIEVVIEIFDSNETMLAKLQAGAGGIYSLIYPSDYIVQEMVELDLLAPLDHSRILRLDDLFPNYQDPAYDPGNQYSVPISWGTTGLAYNRTLLQEAPEDWSYLWEKADDLSRRVTLLNDVRETLGAALKYQGHSYNSREPKEVEQAYEALVRLKPDLAAFTSSAWRDQLLAGDLLMAMAYSVDASEVIEENPDLIYMVPKSGSSLWTDTLVIPKNAPNPDAAYAWINLMFEPEVAAGVMQRLFFATPSKTAYDLLPDEFRNDATLFPPEEILAKCEGIAPVGEAMSEVYDRFWTQLTSG